MTHASATSISAAHCSAAPGRSTAFRATSACARPRSCSFTGSFSPQEAVRRVGTAPRPSPSRPAPRQAIADFAAPMIDKSPVHMRITKLAANRGLDGDTEMIALESMTCNVAHQSEAPKKAYKHSSRSATPSGSTAERRPIARGQPRHCPDARPHRFAEFCAASLHEGPNVPWSLRHRDWLASLDFADRASQQLTIADYLHPHDVPLARPISVRAKPSTAVWWRNRRIALHSLSLPAPPPSSSLFCQPCPHSTSAPRDRRVRSLRAPRPALRVPRDRPLGEHPPANDAGKARSPRPSPLTPVGC